MDDLYIMQAGPSGPIKIGRTRDVWARQRNMQANSPFEIDTLLIRRGQGCFEHLWHQAFAADHLRGEWFEYTPAVAKAVDLARRGGDWRKCLFPPDDVVAAATAGALDADDFEACYWECVEDWRASRKAPR